MNFVILLHGSAYNVVESPCGKYGIDMDPYPFSKVPNSNFTSKKSYNSSDPYLNQVHS
jgi:hypothetical protein